MQKRYIILVISILFVVSGCAAKNNSYQEKMYTLASALTKLSSAVEATVRYTQVDQNISDEKLLELATQHDPSLKEPFNEFSVKILQQNRHAIVLICTKDEAGALLEDAGCTAEMDYHRWLPKELPPCEFTLSSEICNH
jgi:hypothetical protein